MTTGNFRSKILIFVILILTALPYPAAAQTPAPPAPRFGLVDSYVNRVEADASGAGWTRIFIRWDVVQPAGPGDWKPANVPDTFIDAEIAAGREVVAVLIGTPAWATDSRSAAAVPPFEYWSNFVFQIATQYQGRINHWVIWNQPDVTDPASTNFTWAGTEEDYYRLLKEAYHRIKAVDPQMQVHLAGLTYTWDRDRGQPQYLERLLNVIAADPEAATHNFYFDVAGYHLYHNPRLLMDAVTEARAVLERFSLSQPIWINETNAPPAADESAGLAEQSHFIIQAFALGLAGGAERIAVNKLRDDDPAAANGLLRSDDSRRPAFDAFKVATTHLAGASRYTWQNTAGVYAVSLQRGEQITTVLWNTNPAPTTFRLTSLAGQALLVDETGAEQTIAAANGVYAIELPAAGCGSANCAIGGPPRLVIEAGTLEQRANLTPPVVATATPAPSPTAAPVEAATPLPPPTLTSTPLPTALQPPTPLPTDSLASPAAPPAPAEADAPPPGAVLPDSGPPSLQSDTVEPEVTPVPPVSLRTVFKPHRILWLFIIGLIIFAVSYGIQVAIWYRFKR